MKIQRQSIERLKFNVPLAAALVALLLSKHTALEAVTTASVLQLAGIGVVLAVWLWIALRSLRTEKPLLLSLGLLVVLFGAFGFGNFEGVPNFLNSAAVLLSFPVAITIGKRLERESLATTVIATTVGVIAVGVLLASQLTTSYLGDSREARTTLGFIKPTFLAEAALMVLFAAGIKRRRAWLTAAAAVVAIYLTGSRTALIAAAAFVTYMTYTKAGSRVRSGLLLATPVLALVVHILTDTTIDELNILTSGRFVIWSTEIEANVRGLLWIFGNSSPTQAFWYATERTGSVYHLDSFYVERLIVTGVLGLALIVVSVWAFVRRVDAPGRAVVVACALYGVSENTIFNLTSAFAFFPLLLSSAVAHRTQPEGLSAPLASQRMTLGVSPRVAL